MKKKILLVLLFLVGLLTITGCGKESSTDKKKSISVITISSDKKDYVTTFKSTDEDGFVQKDPKYTQIHSEKLGVFISFDYIESPKESGYRSLHLVMEIPVYLSKTEHHVRVEIQLRTIAMDFWASLDHQLHYKNDAEVPDSIRRELFRVAETIAMTDREMEEIAIELQALD